MKKKMIALLLCGTMLFAPVTTYASSSSAMDALKEAYKELEKSTKNSKSKTSKETMTDHFEVDLGAGNYVAGKDIPVGTYNFTATSGTGNVNSSNLYNGGINAIMGTPANDYTEETYNNVSLDDDVVLSVNGNLVLHIVSENASTSTVQARVAPEDSQTIDLTSGHYTAGTDIPVGSYNVVATSGCGNVSSDNLYDGGINEIMGVSESAPADLSIESFSNLVLEEGTALSVDGVSVQLVPVGE